FGTVQFQLLAHGQNLAFLVLFGQLRHVGRWRWNRAAQQRFQDPAPAQHRTGTVWMRRYRENTGMAQDAAPVRVVELHQPHVLALDAGYLVERRQPLVDERILGVDQLQNVPIFSNHVVETKYRFFDHGLGQGVVEFGKELGVGTDD